MKRRSTDLRGWIFLTGDINWADYSGVWAKKAPDGSWYVLKFDNVEDSIGERDLAASGLDRYSCDVKRVVLSEISHEQKLSALRSCDYYFDEQGRILSHTGEVIAGSAEQIELYLVECLVGYGTAQHLESFSDMHYADRARGCARRYAESMMRDTTALRKTLERPVNAIGTTAEEYGSGDALAGLRRYQESGQTGEPKLDLMSRLMGKV